MSAQMSNTSTELAKTRNRAAAERTTLAWIRTALALISFGFGLDKIISAIRDAGGDGNTNQDFGVQLMSMGFIGVGIFTLLIAMRQHKRELIRLLAQINPESSNRNAKTPITRTAVAVAIEREGSSR